MATRQKNNRRKVCCSLKFGESAGALILFCYTQTIKQLYLLCDLHSHDTHSSYPSKIVFSYWRTNNQSPNN